MKRFSTFMAENTFLQLKHVDLMKRGGYRLKIFTDKVKDREYFATKKGAVMITSPSFNELKTAMSKKGYSTTMNGKTDKGRSVNLKYPHDFFKTPEFGGKGSGSGTAAEDRELKGLRDEIEKAMKKDGISVLPMMVGNKKVMAVGVQSTFGTPKSDFHLVDAAGNEVAWISHKDGATSKDFQQYGGLTNSIFKNNKAVKSFMDTLLNKYPNGMERGKSAYRTVTDKKLINQSVWGVDFGRARGRNNVDEFHQGPMKIKKRGKLYYIQSKHQDTNGKLPKGEGYDAIFYARFTSDRGSNVAGVRVPFARVGVFPRASARSKNAEEI